MTSFTAKSREFGPGIVRIRPVNFKFNPDGIPQELKDRKQWVIWSLVEKDNDSTAKTPVYINGSYVGLAKWSLDRAMLFDDAYKLYRDNMDVVAGVGFMFDKTDPYVFVDFDKVIDKDDSRLQYLSQRTWVERSQSGTGYHMLLKGVIPKASRHAGVELYSWGRFCAMTGDILGDCMTIDEDQGLIDRIIQEYIIGHSADSGLGKFSNKGVFVLPDVIEQGNRDTTLFAYCGSLVYKGFDTNDIISFMREANEERCKPPLEDSVIINMVSRQVEAAIKRDEDQKLELIENVVHVAEEDKYYDFRSNSLMNRSAMNTRHRKHFPGTKQSPVVTVWLERHDDFKKANCLGWMPAPHGSNEYRLFEAEGKMMVNTWVGWSVKPVKGSVDAWLEHLSHVVVEEEYRRELIKWLAYMVRFPQLKCNWQIALVGIEGAGKDALFKPISMMLGSAAKVVGNEDIIGGFDDGFVRTKFVIVSEARGLRNNAIERLKRICASEGVGMSMMNVKKEAKMFMPNLWAVAVITNHMDALRLSATERRFFVLRAKTVMSDSMKETYFTWLEKEGGASSLMWYLLHEVSLDGFDPNKLPCLTTHFYDMFESTRDEGELMLSELEDTGMLGDLVLPELIMVELRARGITCGIREITKWLKEHNYSSYTEYSSAFKIAKKIDGKMVCKSRLWLYRNGGKYDPRKRIDKLSPLEVYEACEKVEKTFVNRKF